MSWRRIAVLAALCLCTAACASSSGSGRSSTHDSPRSRCLGQPGTGNTDRPLVFLFCIESP